MSVYSCESCSDLFDDDYAEHLCENDMFCPKCDERISQEREERKEELAEFHKEQEAERRKERMREEREETQQEKEKPQ